MSKRDREEYSGGGSQEDQVNGSSADRNLTQTGGGDIEDQQPGTEQQDQHQGDEYDSATYGGSYSNGFDHRSNAGGDDHSSAAASVSTSAQPATPAADDTHARKKQRVAEDGSALTTTSTPTPSSSVVETPGELRLLVPSVNVGALIGKKGANITQLRQTSGCVATILTNDAYPNAPERILCLKGNLENLAKAIKMVLQLLTNESLENENASKQLSIVFLIHRLHLEGYTPLMKEIQLMPKGCAQISPDVLGTSTEKSVTLTGSHSFIHASAVRIATMIYRNPLKPGTKIINYQPGAGMAISTPIATNASSTSAVSHLPHPPPMPHSMLPMNPAMVPMHTQMPMNPFGMPPPQMQPGMLPFPPHMQGAYPPQPQTNPAHYPPPPQAFQPYPAGPSSMPPYGYPPQQPPPYGYPPMQYGVPGPFGGPAYPPPPVVNGQTGPSQPHAYPHPSHVPHGAPRDRLSDPNCTQQRIAIPSQCSGVVIGHGGSIVRQLVQQSGAKISLAAELPSTPGERIATITGTPEQCQAAIALIAQQVESYNPAVPPPPRPAH